MRDRKNPRGLSIHQTSLLHQHPTAAQQLPHPSVEWQWRDIDVHNGILARFSDRDLIKIHGFASLQDHRHTWTTPTIVAEYIDDEIEPPSNQTICGHTGIVNLGNGEYTCSNEDCDARFGRTEAREVIEA